MSSITTLPNAYLFMGVVQVLDHARMGVAEALEVVHALCRECQQDEANAVRFYSAAPDSTPIKDMYEGIVAALLRVPVRVITRMSVDWSECYPRCPKAGRNPMTDAEIISHFAARLRRGGMRVATRPALQRQMQGCEAV